MPRRTNKPAGGARRYRNGERPEPFANIVARLQRDGVIGGRAGGRPPRRRPPRRFRPGPRSD